MSLKDERVDAGHMFLSPFSHQQPTGTVRNRKDDEDDDAGRLMTAVGCWLLDSFKDTLLEQAYGNGSFHGWMTD